MSRYKEIERVNHRIHTLRQRLKVLEDTKERMLTKTKPVKVFGYNVWEKSVPPNPERLLEISCRIVGLQHLIDLLKHTEKMLIQEVEGDLRVTPTQILHIIEPTYA